MFVISYFTGVGAAGRQQPPKQPTATEAEAAARVEKAAVEAAAAAAAGPVTRSAQLQPLGPLIRNENHTSTQRIAHPQ